MLTSLCILAAALSLGASAAAGVLLTRIGHFTEISRLTGMSNIASLGIALLVAAILQAIALGLAMRVVF